jgi:hypothetical protein
MASTCEQVLAEARVFAADARAGRLAIDKLEKIGEGIARRFGEGLYQGGDPKLIMTFVEALHGVFFDGDVRQEIEKGRKGAERKALLNTQAEDIAKRLDGPGRGAPKDLLKDYERKTQDRIDQLREREAQKTPTDKAIEQQNRIAALAGGSGLDYAAGAKAAAKELGIPRKVIDEEVRRWREDHKPREQKDAEKANVKAALDELNARHTVLENLGGKCVVMEFVSSEIHQGLLIPSYQSVDTIKNRYSNRLVYSDGKPHRLGDYWLKYAGRTQYHSLALVPNGPEVLSGNVLNLWKGFGIKPAPGDWSLMQDHVLQVLANGDADVSHYILNWSAWCVQNPDKPAEVALVMRGEEGLGKGIFFRSLGECFGSHYLHVTSQKHVSGQFNSHLQGCIFLFADEAFAVRDKNAESILKALITEPVLMIEPKGINPFQSKNLIKIGMASNARWVVPVSHSARRYMMLDVVVRRDEAYFRALYEQMKNGGREAMLYDLLQRPLAVC